VLLLHAGHASLLAPQPGIATPFEVLVPLTGAACTPEMVVPVLERVRRVADIGVFRLLFPALDPAAAFTLNARMKGSVARAGLPCELPTSAALAAAGDPARIAAALRGWTLPMLRRNEPSLKLERLT